jgi:hypothetical protein
MFENPYNQTLQDQIGQLNRLLGGQSAGGIPEVPTAANRFDYVVGIEGARAFLQKMLANTKHIVWDSEKPIFYILQKDANGNPMRIQICPFTVEQEPTMEEKYVLRSDFNALVSKIDTLIAQKEVTNNG